MLSTILRLLCLPENLHNPTTHEWTAVKGNRCMTCLGLLLFSSPLSCLKSLLSCITLLLSRPELTLLPGDQLLLAGYSLPFFGLCPEASNRCTTESEALRASIYTSNRAQVVCMSPHNLPVGFTSKGVPASSLWWETEKLRAYSAPKKQL